jgi:death on curing protein
MAIKRTAYITASSFLELNGYILCNTDWDLYFATKLIANNRWDIDRIAQWLEENSVLESEYIEGMQIRIGPLIEWYEEYIEMSQEINLQESLTEEEIKELKRLEILLNKTKKQN